MMSAMLGSVLVFIGTYTTDGISEGIYVLRFSPENGLISDTGLRANARNPTFLALHPNNATLYTVTETADSGGKPSGAVAAYSIDGHTGELTFLDEQLSMGRNPCHVSVDPAGRMLFVANYGSGSVTVLPIQEDGSLRHAHDTVQHEGSGPNASRQKGPHAHSITPDPKTGLLYACDLGIDRIMVYRTEERGFRAATPPALSTPPGAGPRHLDFHPNGRWLYVVNELDSTVSVFTRTSPEQPFGRVQTVSTLPEDDAGDHADNTGADIHVSHAGRFVYASNRGHDSIAVFAVNMDDGTLKPAGHDSVQGQTPRNFALDPTGKWLLAANQDSNTITVFRTDPDTGRLHFTGHQIEVPKPVCIRFLARH